MELVAMLVWLTVCARFALNQVALASDGTENRERQEFQQSVHLSCDNYLKIKIKLPTPASQKIK
jgi:hypothetical protein